MFGNKKKEKASQENKLLPSGWITVLSKRYPGKVYYFNKVTKCTTWELPSQLSQDKSNKSSFKTLLPERNKPKTKKSSKRKKIKKKNVNVNLNPEIEDYDEENDQYFSHTPTNLLLTPPSKKFIPPRNSNLSLPSHTNHQIINSTSSSTKDERILGMQFGSSLEKLLQEKSTELCDLEKPSTSQKTSELNLVKESLNSYKLVKLESDESKKEIWKSKKKKKKKKKKRSESLSEINKSNLEKIINVSTFKKNDKTPAQTRLQKIRKKNVELLRNFTISKSPSSSQSHSTQLPVSGSTQTDSTEIPKSDSLIDGHSEKVDDRELNKGIEENLDFVEEMDWEPSPEEIDVQNINVFRQQRDKINNPSSETIFGFSSNNTLLPSKSNFWLLILDTNILISCLNFIKDLRDTNVRGMGFPLLYVPWRVLQELDHLKSSKLNTVGNVRKAISYLNENFKSQHPRCFGQSFEDFSKMVDVDAFAPDDEILQTCLQLQKLHKDKKLTLLTNDKNLESKAIISGVEAFSKERFQKKFLYSSSEGNDKIPQSSEASSSEIDTIVCEAKTILKKLIPRVVETEMKIAFQKDWIRLAFKKPPWSLQDAIDCFIKHWRSVFFLIFSKTTLSEVEVLNEKLFKNEPDSVEEGQDMLKTIQKLFNSMKTSLKEKRDYIDLLNASETKVSELLRMRQEESKFQVNNEVSIAESSFPHSMQPHTPLPGNESQNRFDSFLFKEDQCRMKNLFRDIWDRLWNFRCYVSEAISSPLQYNSISLPELRLKVSQILKEVNDLICIIEEILIISVNDIHENHPLILSFSNFLIEMCPTMNADLKNRLLISAAAFFSDIQERSSLRGVLNDFREFCQDLIKAIEYFNSNYPGL